MTQKFPIGKRSRILKHNAWLVQALFSYESRPGLGIKDLVKSPKPPFTSLVLGRSFKPEGVSLIISIQKGINKRNI